MEAAPRFGSCQVHGTSQQHVPLANRRSARFRFIPVLRVPALIKSHLLRDAQDARICSEPAQVTSDAQRHTTAQSQRCLKQTVFGSTIFSASATPGAMRKRITKISRSRPLNVGRFDDCLCSTLSWWRRATISASREDRDRKNPVRADQTSWSISTMAENINRFDVARQPDRFYGRDRPDRAPLHVGVPSQMA